MSTTRKSYTEEFKREAVALVEKIGNRSQVARDLGIHMSLLRKWQEKINGNPDRPFPEGKAIHRMWNWPGLKRKTLASKRRWRS